MNLPEILKQFKTITPDPAYKEKSKRMVLSTIPARGPWSMGRTIAAIFETGTAVALVVFSILLVTGQFSGAASYVSPIQLSAINPETLHAEAHAVDMQIQLAQIAYEEATTTPVIPAVSGGETTKPSFEPALSAVVSPAATPDTTTSTAAASDASSSDAAATTTPTLSVDEALQQLSN